MNRGVPSPGVFHWNSRVVGDALFESQLQQVITHTIHSDALIFGPESFFWRISREVILFMGAGRSTLLQLVNLWVRDGYGSTFKHRTHLHIILPMTLT